MFNQHENGILEKLPSPVPISQPSTSTLSSNPGPSGLNTTDDIDPTKQIPTNVYDFPYECVSEDSEVSEEKDIFIPQYLRRLGTLQHGTIVSAVAISDHSGYVFTGGRGSVNMWDLHRPATACLSTQLSCFNVGECGYIRCLSLLPDEDTLVVSGESRSVFIWDLADCTPRVKGELRGTAAACFAHTISSDSKLCFCCCSDGSVSIWDLHSQILIRKFQGHTDTITCTDISPDGTKLWTGSLDKTIRCWDLNQGEELQLRCLDYRIYSLSCCPSGKWLAVASNNLVQVVHTYKPNNHQLNLHERNIMCVKFDTSGNWFISAGLDNLLGGWKSPDGPSSFHAKESSPLVCCDISEDSGMVVAGTQDGAIMYGVI